MMDEEKDETSRDDKIMYKAHELREERRKEVISKQNYKNPYDSSENKINSEGCLKVEAQDRSLSG